MEYQQALAVPFRIEQNNISFCLITSRSRGDWIFPKGNIEKNETPEEAALKEACEEAGLEGKVVTTLGAFYYKKWERSRSVLAHLMEVSKCRDTWQEQHERKRRWFTIEEAQQIIDRAELLSLLEKAVSYISDDE